MKLILLLLAATAAYAATSCVDSETKAPSAKLCLPEVDAPYCTPSDPKDPTKFECRACMSPCDCAVNEYCFLNPNSNEDAKGTEIGTCVSYKDKIGTKCAPLDISSLIGAGLKKDDKSVDRAGCNEVDGLKTQFHCSDGTKATFMACEVDRVVPVTAKAYPGFQWWGSQFFRLPLNVWILLIFLEITCYIIFTCARGRKGYEGIQ